MVGEQQEEGGQQQGQQPSMPTVTAAAKAPTGLVEKLLIKRFKPTNKPEIFRCNFCTVNLKYDNSNSTGLERHL